ncbi:MAG: sulfite exporter TauE/SafE family protein [Candidatus Melainabacteria bacterium]|nr:sulfite exporter TauE/SafE family protein [Candidatus Melainabacteria bacterium]
MPDINLFYLFTALLYGMVHAMEPGHGKSLVATFVLSTKINKARDAFLIGLIASITHTASVYLIGFSGLKFLEFISPIDKEIFINFVASLLIFLIGLWLMWDRIIKPLFHHEHKHQCSVHEVLTKNLKITNILLIGLTAGLVPCTGGLAVFMTATAVSGFHNLLNGFLYVLSFSIGLGIALSLVALSMIFSQGFLKSLLQKSMSNIEKSSGVISAILIYTLGLILLTGSVVKLIPERSHHHVDHHLGR